MDSQGTQPSPGSLGAMDEEDNKRALRDKMKDLFAKFITDIDQHVMEVGQSQCELDSQLDQLIETIDSIKVDEKLTAEISENAKKISSLKSRLTVIHTILNEASARCSRTLAACGSACKAQTDQTAQETT